MKILPPLAALAFGAMTLAACGNDEKVAENTYATPSERDASGYPSAQPAMPSPGTPGNPVPGAIPPASPDDPQPLPPGSPPTPLPN
jgi:hypothetical protein